MKVLKIAHDTPKHKMIMLPPDRLADRLPQAARSNDIRQIFHLWSFLTPSAASNLALVPRRDQPLRQKPKDRF
jgi:hypothetical protein